MAPSRPLSGTAVVLVLASKHKLQPQPLGVGEGVSYEDLRLADWRADLSEDQCIIAAKKRVYLAGLDAEPRRSVRARRLLAAFRSAPSIPPHCCGTKRELSNGASRKLFKGNSPTVLAERQAARP